MSKKKNKEGKKALEKKTAKAERKKQLSKASSKAKGTKKKKKKEKATKQKQIYFLSNSVLEKIKFDVPPTVSAEMPFVVHSDAPVKEIVAKLEASALGGLLVLDRKTRQVIGAVTSDMKAAKGCKCGGKRDGFGNMKKCAKEMSRRNPDCKIIMCDRPTITGSGNISSCRITCMDGSLGGGFRDILDRETPGGDWF